MRIKLLGLAFLSLLTVLACNKEDEPTDTDCSSLSPTYTANIKSIMDTNCAISGCHTAADAQGGYALDTYAGTFSAAADNKFLCSIDWSGSCQRMPDGGSQLASGDISLVSCWIQNGRPQ
ncbi:MAG: hypothetical protein H6579_04120 [Chitinophagales bacterium]|nr:hypothetical protein [Chitinophagales bacterium]